MKQFFLFLTFGFFVQNGFSQSINGNLNAAKTNESLGYGNVDIYQGEKLVASVLTDREGNFNVALDTGLYKCVVNYSGYKPVTKEIRVRHDEKLDFTVTEDPNKPKSAKAEQARAMSAESSERDEMAKINARYLSGAPVTNGFARTTATDDAAKSSGLGLSGPMKTDGIPSLPGRSGALTAGEINDFAKWNLWQDYTNNGNVLNYYQNVWNIAPKGRYTLELHNQNGIPLVDALVRLKKGDGSEVFKARTDNTGKAEMWLTMLNVNPEIPQGLFIEVDYNGKLSRINDVKPFEKSMNHLVLDVTCEQSENVDIAFVVDATGSMGDELSYLQSELNDIIFQSKQISSKLNFRFANVFYRDAGPNEIYTTRSMDFDRILSASVDYISEQSAGGGGDYEEAVEIALDSAINGLSWSKNARTRVLFLILDAPPHKNPQVQEKLQRLILQAAEKGIRIVPIGASGIDKGTEYLMRSMALGTNGTYTFLTDHSGIGDSHIAPTTDQFDVETLNKLMVRILKSYTYMPDCEQQLPNLELPYPDSIVAYPPPADSLDSAGNVVVVDPRETPIDSVSVKWNYYPNPTNGIVNITADVDITELYVTDLSGKVLQVLTNLEKDRTIQIDLSEYATGIYLIRYPLGKTWVSGKVVLQRTS
ncbi:MAG: hypothetical protein A3D31_13375 [Candidatus Fluviicola riflensis]|nr:MAG: hypothetical protein CHH17_17810 [Candidatus Fluviicola riflensis]OGS77969.1 MAG: hypothetical protein A3D31_13375 [Candidatus Fluviicola riflensis]OGS85034.1 MAG: hypothetical protein A2724_10310 [Fluviicola sp. RIFCSPHIGHO2_01_FULL_43_53]OGS89306.1 MAG: hypothetical protein A3E30_04615 [Fluviicola sp. RIFCSPHIGHO2_12_FULL_43_24]